MDAVIGNKGLFLTRNKDILVECLNDLKQILDYYKNTILGENYVFKNDKKLVSDLKVNLEYLISFSNEENKGKYEQCLNDLNWVVEKIYIVEKSIKSMDKNYEESLKRDEEREKLPAELTHIVARNLHLVIKEERDSKHWSSDADSIMTKYLQLSFDEQKAVIADVIKKAIEDVNTITKENEERKINSCEHKLRETVFGEICFEKVDPTDPLDQRGEYRQFTIKKQYCPKCGMIKYNKINSEPLSKSNLDKETEEVLQRARNFSL